MPPGKSPKSATIKIGKFIVQEYADGADEFKSKDLLRVSGLSKKTLLDKIIYIEFRGYFKYRRENDAFSPDLENFKAEENPQAAFLNDIKDFVSILEAQAKPKERRG